MSDKSFAIDSIRNHNEIFAFKKEFGDELLVLAINAPIEVRYKRVINRTGQYKEQDMTFGEFKAIHERDMGEINEENEQNVKKCLDLADIELDNFCNPAELEKKLENLYKEHFS